MMLVTLCCDCGALGLTSGSELYYAVITSLKSKPAGLSYTEAMAPSWCSEGTPPTLPILFLSSSDSILFSSWMACWPGKCFLDYRSVTKQYACHLGFLKTELRNTPPWCCISVKSELTVQTLMPPAQAHDHYYCTSYMRGYSPGKRKQTHIAVHFNRAGIIQFLDWHLSLWNGHDNSIYSINIWGKLK